MQSKKTSKIATVFIEAISLVFDYSRSRFFLRISHHNIFYVQSTAAAP